MPFPKRMLKPPERLFENKWLIKNNKSFWVPPFFKKVAFFEAFEKSFTEKLLYDCRMFSGPNFQTVSEGRFRTTADKIRCFRVPPFFTKAVPGEAFWKTLNRKCPYECRSVPDLISG
ncbi:hypothetical protein [Komagataeibacter europaeus]|uniref:hypothetical protein n=1 Tax=Komagataeibacter europaeus TaxID=33995 RepID=UPI0012FA01FE|nr:hypothetical protein [Komagataeibacter europaeus]